MKNETRQLLKSVRDGEISIDDAILQLKQQPFEDIDFAKLDTHRSIRQGVPEVIYGESKTADQIAEIIRTLRDAGHSRIIATRVSREKATVIQGYIDGVHYYEQPRLLLVGEMPKPDGLGDVLVICAGTSDIPVAEEAALTAEMLGNKVVRAYDAGVAGIHRTFSHIDDIMQAKVIIAIAGMEGALPTVVGGLADCPVIAVPTSVGYGASFGGVSALLSMLNSCASGVSVVNIDNGFGAAYSAHLINHLQ